DRGTSIELDDELDVAARACRRGARSDLVGNGRRILVTRIVAADDEEVCFARGQCAHDPAVVLIAAAGEAERQQYAVRTQLADGVQGFFERLGGVRKVDGDREGVGSLDQG